MTKSPVGKNFLRTKAKISTRCVKAKFLGGSEETVEFKEKQ